MVVLNKIWNIGLIVDGWSGGKQFKTINHILFEWNIEKAEDSSIYFLKKYQDYVIIKK